MDRLHYGTSRDWFACRCVPRRGVETHVCCDVGGSARHRYEACYLYADVRGYRELVVIALGRGTISREEMLCRAPKTAQ